MLYNRRMCSYRLACSLAIGLVAGVFVSANPHAQQQPTFRSGIDLVTVDVAVLDRNGSPVAGLEADDFIVVAGRRPRRIVGVDFVSSLRPARAHAFMAAPGGSSNRRIVAPRTLIFLVDVEQIPAGAGRTAMRGIGEYLDRLAPEDRVGLLTLADTRVGTTTDRATIRESVSKLVGVSARLRDKEMTFGEAPGIAARDMTSLRAYWSRIADQGGAFPGDRTCAPPQGFEMLTAVPATCSQQAEGVLERFRYETRRVLGRLGVIAEAMATLPEPKAIVLVSGGLFSDVKVQNDLAEFGRLAERTHVSLSALLVEPDGSSGGGNTSGTLRLDSQFGFGGLVDVSAASRGSAHRVGGDSAAALARLDRELSGHYVLSFERDPADAEGERMDLEVKTRRADVTVRTRKGLTPTRPMGAPDTSGAAPDLKAGVAALLKTSAAVGQVPVDVDAFAMPSAANGNESRMILAVEFGRNPEDLGAFGFQIADASGKVIGDGYDAPPKAQKVGDRRARFVTTVSATAGKYVVRVGAIDKTGQRGSLQHAFEIEPWAANPIRVSDLMFGGAEGGVFNPGAGTPAADGLLGIRLVVRDSTQKFDDVRVRLTIARAADAGPVDMVDAPLQATADPLRRFADGALNVSLYPPGEYVITAVVTARGADVGRKMRVFVR